MFYRRNEVTATGMARVTRTIRSHKLGKMDKTS
jgi:hypothetical protein